MHSFRLEHFTHGSCKDFVDSIVTSVQDYGTERAVRQVRCAPMNNACGFFERTGDEHIRLIMARVRLVAYAFMERGMALNNEVFEGCEATTSDEFDDTAGQAQNLAGDAVLEDVWDDLLAGDEVFEDVVDDSDMDVDVSFAHIVDLPPLHHIIDGATKGLCDAMPIFKSQVPLIREGCKLIRRSKKKLLERFFASPVATCMHCKILPFQASVSGRWGDLVFALPELLFVETAMRKFWNKAKLVGHDRDHVLDGDRA